MSSDILVYDTPKLDQIPANNRYSHSVLRNVYCAHSWAVCGQVIEYGSHAGEPMADSSFCAISPINSFNYDGNSARAYHIHNFSHSEKPQGLAPTLMVTRLSAASNKIMTMSPSLALLSNINISDISPSKDGDEPAQDDPAGKDLEGAEIKSIYISWLMWEKSI